MVHPHKVFVWESGIRFEVTPDGLIYSPEDNKQRRKHKCHDCKSCAWCADSRCNVCLSQKGPARKQ